jgi:hypothetical protein
MAVPFDAVSVYDRPYLYPKQLAAIFPTGKRWALCEASTKSGKTAGAIVRIIEAALGASVGQNFWWVAPVADQARIAFTRVKQHLTAGAFTSRESPTPSITLITGAIIWFKSADNPDSLYGEDVFGAIIDEASRAKPDAWYAVRSTLTATQGWAVIIGNVKGRRNWFYEWCRRVEAGRDPNAAFQRITWRDACAAGVLDVAEIDDARRNLPEQVFRELYEAEASDDGGNPFGLDHIAQCVGELSQKPPVAFGIDLAKKQDYLVVIGLDEDGSVCRFERWRGVPWRESIIRIHGIVGEDIRALVDSTGVGDPVLEELQVGYGNFIGYNFTLLSKQRLMEGLAVSIQSHETRFPPGPIVDELNLFEYEYTRTGVRYSATEGYNDDCVCSLALARQMLTEIVPGANLMSYYAAESRRLSAANDQNEKPNNHPWRADEDLGEQFANELTELYEETVKNLTPRSVRNCFACKTEVSPANRVSDGEHVWHPGCFSTRLVA